MELRVLVEGEERTVSGVNETTTCEAIILAIAKASSQDGKYEMIEKFRNVERRLSSKDKPLDILHKWNEHASSVVFILRRITEEEEDPFDAFGQMKGYSSPTGTLPTYRQPSTSSISSILNHSTNNLQKAQWSSSSLPLSNQNAAYSQIQKRNRAPPPDYKTVMDQKFASLSRGPQSRPSIPVGMVDDNAIANMKLSHNDLLALIEKQRITLEKQKENLSTKELGLRTDDERELLQLRRQQENLRIILQPLKEANWTQQYQSELKKSQKLKAQIEATKEAIDKTKSDLERVIKEEEGLKQQIQTFKAENLPFPEMNSIGKTMEESTQKSPRKISAY